MTKTLLSAMMLFGVSLAVVLPQTALAAPRVFNISNNADTIISGEKAAGRSGLSVISVGDLDNDGYDDLLIPEEMSSINGGQLYLFYGDTLSTTPLDLSDADAVIKSSSTHKLKSYDRDGIGSGDLNGDGFLDIVISTTFIIYGDGTRFTGENSIEDIAVSLTVTSKNSVEMLGDINSDGFDDMLIGDHWADFSYAGAAYLVMGQADQFETGTPVANLATATFAGTYFRASNSSATGATMLGDIMTHGDLNGDGFTDIVLASREETKSHQANVYVFYNTGTGFSGDYTLADADYVLEVLKPMGDWTKTAMNIADINANGDFNRDGYDDLFVGAGSQNALPDADVVAEHRLAGNVYVLYGKSTQYSGTKAISSVAKKIKGTPNSQFGYTISYLDFNKDNTDDVLIGTAVSGNRVYLFQGEPSKVLPRTSSATMLASAYFKATHDNRGNDSSSNVGEYFTVGDVSGDGQDDVIFSLPFSLANGKELAGKTYVVHGQAFPIGRELFEPASHLSSVTALSRGRMRMTYVDGYTGYVQPYPNAQSKGKATLIDLNSNVIFGSAITNAKGTKITAYNENRDESALTLRSSAQQQVELAAYAREGSPSDLLVATLDSAGNLEVTHFSYDGLVLTLVDSEIFTGFTYPTFILELDTTNNVVKIIYDDDVIHSATISDAGLAVN